MSSRPLGLGLCLLLALALSSTSAFADPHATVESGDARASAFDLDPFFEFTADADIFNATATAHASVTGVVDDPNDVDWYSFDGTAGATVDLDIDCGSWCGAGVDVVVSLFDANRTLLAFDDDSDLDAGSLDVLDPFVGTYGLPASGAYYVAVSNYANFPNAVHTGVRTPLIRPDSAFGGSSVAGSTIGDDTFDNDGNPVSGDYILHLSTSLPPLLASALVNGSFEDSFNSGWSAAGSVIPAGTAGASEGVLAALFSSGDTPNDGLVSQNLPTVPGVEYMLAFDFAAHGSGTQSVRVEILGAATLVDATIVDPGTMPATFTRHFYRFIADTGSPLLRFQDVSSATVGVDMIVDDVVIAPVPEAETGPSTLVNGSFEDGISTGWIATGDVVASGSEGTTDGTVAGLFRGDTNPALGILEQASIPTVPGAAYLLEFDFGAAGAAKAQTLRVEVIGAGTLLGPEVSDLGSIQSTFDRYRFCFVADSELTTLRFTDISGDTIAVDPVLDRVSISPFPVPAVPVGVPAMALAILLAAGGAVLLRCRHP